MNRALICGPLAAALCLSSVAPASAQDYRFTGFDAPRGATATVNLRVPLGPTARRRPSVGVAVAYGRPVGAPDVYGHQQVRQVSVADFRLDGNGPGHLRLAGTDMRLYSDSAGEEESGGKKDMMLLIFMILAGMTTLVFLIDGDDSEDSPSDSPSPGLG